MKLGFLIYGSLDTLSGGYLYDRKLVAHLRARGHSVEIVSIPWRNYPRHLIDNFSRQLHNQLSAIDVDILIQDELNHPSLFLMNGFLKKRVRYPIISLVHHLRASEQHPGVVLGLYRFIERIYLRGVDGYIFNSHTTRGVVEKETGTCKPNVVAHPTGDRLPIEIDEQTIRARLEQQGPLKLLFLGNVIPRKGLHTLLEALALLNPAVWQLTIAGDLRIARGYANRMQQFVQKHGWSDRVSFLGAVHDEKLTAVMHSHHVLAVPSLYEGFGIAYLEGMGMGLPAVGTTAGAAHEVISNGADGFLVPPGAPEKLAKVLAMLSKDRQKLLSMSLAARKRFLRHPGWEASMEQVHLFLQGIKV